MLRYFEDFNVDDEFTGPARTITEGDIVNFAALTGDWNPIHTDVEFAKASPYGERIAHGMLGLSFTIGLLDRTGIFSGSAIANLGIQEWTFTAPIYIGDTIHFRMKITEKRLTSDGKRGVIGRSFEVLNQRDEVVQRGSSPLMIRVRPDPQLTATPQRELPA
jgi:acyl dehydratase